MHGEIPSFFFSSFKSLSRLTYMNSSSAVGVNNERRDVMCATKRQEIRVVSLGQYSTSHINL